MRKQNTQTTKTNNKMENENQILREAVINLTMENAKLKSDLKKEKETSEMWWESVKRKSKRIEELEAQLNGSIEMPEGCKPVKNQ